MAEAGAIRWWWVRHAPIARKGTYTLRDEPAEFPDSVSPVVLPAGAHWLASPLPRAVATAQWLQSFQPLPCEKLQAVDAFAEQYFGGWEGKRYDEVFAENPGLNWSLPADIIPPGGESFTQMMARVATTIDALGRSMAASDVVAVAHIGVIRAALAHALGLSAPQALSLQVDYLSLTRISYVGSHAMIEGVNQDLWSKRGS